MWAFIAGVDLMGSELLLTEVPRALRGTPEGVGSNFKLGASLMQASILLEEAALYPVRREGLRRAKGACQAGVRVLSPGA